MSGLIIPVKGFTPRDRQVRLHRRPTQTLVGDVEIGANCSIWFGVVLRGDGPGIRIGENSNIQDGSVVHVAARGLPTIVGRDVTVGHMALLHACEVQDGAFIGMHSTVLDGVVVESGAMVAAGALVAPGKIVRSGELWAGNPAQKLRDLTAKDLDSFRQIVAGYVKLSKAYTDPARVTSKRQRPSSAQSGPIGKNTFAP